MLEHITRGRMRKSILLLFFFVYLPFLYHYGLGYIHYASIDFPSFYWAVKLTFTAGKSPYAIGAFSEIAKQLGQYVFPYLYPPPSLLIFSPLLLVSYNTAKGLLLVINHVCILIVIYLMLFQIAQVQRNRGYSLMLPFMLLYVVCYYPIVSTLNHGQMNLLVLVLLCFVWIGTKKGTSPISIAVALILATLLKPYFIALILFMLMNRKFAVVFWFLLLSALLSVVSLAVLPHSLWTDWFAYVLPTGGYGETPIGLGSPAVSWNQSINGFTSRLFLDNPFNSPLLPSPGAARLVPYLASALVVIATVFSPYRMTFLHGEKDIDWEFSLYLLMVYIVAPLSWEHHLVFILPAILIGLMRSFEGRRNWFWASVIAFSAYLLAWELPIDSPRLQTGILTLAISVKFYGVLALWIVFALNPMRSRSTSEFPSPNSAEHNEWTNQL